jgi:hypothetical protein
VRRVALALMVLALAGCAANGPGYMYGATGGGFNSGSGARIEGPR